MKISKLYSKMFLGMGLIGMFLSTYFFSFSVLLVWKMFSVYSHKVDILLIFDWISVSFFSVLCLIVGCVLKFSCIYMEGDKNEYRFILLVLSFVLSMSFLMFMPHFMMLLLGWDGLGLTSFLLMVYYSSSSSWGAGLKTYLINRLGDAFLVLCMVLLFSQGHWNMLAYDFFLVSMMVVLFIFGAFTKSAQYPFSSWLPAAMAAPTPVSALVHSSTLVTAGMYLMMRFKYLLPYYVHLVMGLVGLWTLYCASMAACVEWDAKKVIAYSTLSQLGLMCVSLGLGLSMFAFFHLLTHAVFKALLFMCVGYWMSQKNHLQDLRGLNGLWLQNPFCSFCMFMSILALSGFPFLAGFFSKDMMIESNYFLKKMVFYNLFLLSLPLTSFYSFRLFFWLLQKNSSMSLRGKNESLVYLFSVLPLVFCSGFLGWFIGKYVFMSSFPSFSFKLLMLSFMVFGFFISFLLNLKFNLWMNWFSGKIFYMVPLKSSFWLQNFSNVGSFFYNFLDQGWGSQMNLLMNSFVEKISVSLNRFLMYFSTPKFFFYLSMIMVVLMFVSIKVF